LGWVFVRGMLFNYGFLGFLSVFGVLLVDVLGKRF